MLYGIRKDAPRARASMGEVQRDVYAMRKQHKNP